MGEISGSLRKNIGEIIVGFGLLFLGLGFLKDSVPNIEDNLDAFNFIQSYTQMGFTSILIFIFIGIILTFIVQSSSAAMAITITMAYSGWIDFPTACALVLGQRGRRFKSSHLDELIYKLSSQ